MLYGGEWNVVVGRGLIFVTTDTHVHTLKQTGAMSQDAASDAAALH